MRLLSSRYWLFSVYLLIRTSVYIRAMTPGLLYKCSIDEHSNVKQSYKTKIATENNIYTGYEECILPGWVQALNGLLLIAPARGVLIFTGFPSTCHWALHMTRDNVSQGFSHLGVLGCGHPCADWRTKTKAQRMLPQTTATHFSKIPIGPVHLHVLLID